MRKKPTKKLFPRRINQDGSYERCRAKTWGNDPRNGKNRNTIKSELKQGKWD
tara:strand:+ start:237 stop:392 length:156 start_codon:yes stop_codon:yes gene_type:complete